ncbi:small glutamine-rich tetratricopeptide repeat-containing protein beta [Drosophila teissieri]|uniref:small glutamine-rich tetratricopeptide repeat-containing protein beta n=1 Tax=Drosophila teissieri TaxID=7243 RepID=UPI001CB9FE21|nr:small glutamine-rich tetratricopeptide repeat-containing protein beta [Drosophila teissieri]
MPDAVQQSFVRSFIDYLKKQVDVMSPDQSESIEVAIQCLQAAFDLGDDVEAVPDADGQEQATTQSTTASAPDGDAVASGSAGVAPNNNIDMFELFQSLYTERNPESLALADSIKNEGNRLMKESKYNEALLQYNRAIAFDPKNPIFYCNRAAAHIRLGDNERAVTDCKSALVYNNNYSKAYCRLGVAYSNMGKFAEAEQAYGKAIELEPDNEVYKSNLEEARNARNQSPPLSRIRDDLSSILAHPLVRNLFNNAELDVEQLQSMIQNPMVMNTIGQQFANMGQMPALPNDMLQMVQSIASQLAAGQQGGGAPNPNANSGNEQQPGNQPPPSI